MNRLNVRLLLAFAAVLLLTLVFSTVALLLALRSRPVNTDSQYIELAASSLDVNLRELIDYTTALRSENPDARDIEIYIESIRGYMFAKADQNNVRIILFNGQTQEVLLDTEGQLTNQPLPSNLEREPLLGGDAVRPRNTILDKGTFSVDGDTWLFVEQPLLPEGSNVLGVGQNPPQGEGRQTGRNRFFNQPIQMIVAEPYPEPTYWATLQEISDTGLLWAIVQSVLIGMVLAFILSVLFVRWVTHPMLNIAHAAAQVAQGDYSTRVAVDGPDEVQWVAQAFNHMAGRVELTQQAQRDFLANVSHDLRTPLTSIQGFAQAISEGVADSQAADIIYHEASRLNRMVNELLDLARIQAGRMDMLRQAVELDVLLKMVGQNLSIKAEHQGIRLHAEIPQLPRIAGDGDRLAQVFTNLVDNAIKHTPHGGDVAIRAELDEKTKGIVIQIQDTGEGIPAPDVPRIFERFYQVDKSRAKASGTGLGLAITQEIITAHNGRIWVESDYGRGSCFSVWLPQPIGDNGKTVMIPKLTA